MLAMAMTMVLTLRPDPPLPPQNEASERERDEAISSIDHGFKHARRLKDTSAVALWVYGQVSRIGYAAHPSAATRGRGQAKSERNRFPKVDQAAQVTTRYDTANALYHYTQHYYIIYNYMYALVYTI